MSKALIWLQPVKFVVNMLNYAHWKRIYISNGLTMIQVLSAVFTQT